MNSVDWLGLLTDRDPVVKIRRRSANRRQSSSSALVGAPGISSPWPSPHAAAIDQLPVAPDDNFGASATVGRLTAVDFFADRALSSPRLRRRPRVIVFLPRPPPGPPEIGGVRRGTTAMSSADPTNAAGTPPPGAGAGGGAGPHGGPSPQKIGQAFIRQYYKTLLANPSQLNRFYQPDSVVTRGMEPSSLATPAPFNLASTGNGGSVDGAPPGGDDESPGERVRRAFFEWAGEGVVIDFERGAIDAQESIGGGILLVVTGRARLPGDGEGTGPAPFVHTFFLNNAAGPGRKRMFLIKNDILRFLERSKEVREEAVGEESLFEDAVAAAIPPPVAEEPSSPVQLEPVAVVAPVEPPAPVALAEEPPVLVDPLPPLVEPVSIVPVEYEPPADEEKVEDEEVDEPMLVQHTAVDVNLATEEEKIDTLETSSAGSAASPPSPSGEGKKKKNRKKRGGKSRSRSRSNSPRKEEEGKDEPEKPKTPGSWASLVAGGGGGSGGPKGSSGKKGGRRGSPRGSRGGGGGGGGTGGDKAPAERESAKAPPQAHQPATPKESSATTPSTASETPTTAPSPSTAPTPPQDLPPQPRRTPEATLFIRNIPDKTTEPEIRGLFDKYGRILGITLNPARGFCFVDLDGPASVQVVVDEAQSSLVKDERTGRKVSSSFMVHGRVLDVERKVPAKSGGGGPGGRRPYNRSHSPKDGGGRYRGSRGSGGGGMRRSPPRGGGHGGGGGNRS
ncbi:hypothetical protein ACHAWF_005864 [Thalassiosira exigua]